MSESHVGTYNIIYVRTYIYMYIYVADTLIAYHTFHICTYLYSSMVGGRISSSINGQQLAIYGPLLDLLST